VGPRLGIVPGGARGVCVRWWLLLVKAEGCDLALTTNAAATTVAVDAGSKGVGGSLGFHEEAVGAEGEGRQARSSGRERGMKWWQLDAGRGG
jgi:hypothetical protein